MFTCFLFLEISKYLEENQDKTADQSIEFLIKLWNSEEIKLTTKYETIYKYFIKKLLPKTDEIESNTIQKFLSQKHQPNCISLETKSELIKALNKSVKRNPSHGKITICLDLVSLESFKEFFKTRLEEYCKFLDVILKGFSALDVDENDEVFAKIAAELYCFAKIESFPKIFIKNILVSLHEALKKSSPGNKSMVLDLLKSIFFSRITSSESNLEIFQTDLASNVELILIEAFIVINKSNPSEIAKFIKMKNLVENCEDDEKFLNRTKQVFMLLKTNEVDLAPIKRQEKELFAEIAEKVTSVVESLKDSMNFADFLSVLTSFISCDAFLFESNIYEILGDLMLKEKSGIELTNYEDLLNIVLKIYGKDLNQFLKKLLKSLDLKLESVSLFKKRKRKLLSGDESDTIPKKLKLSSGESTAVCIDWSNISHVWPNAIAEQFAEIIAGLNVAQTVKVLSQLNEFLAKSLNSLRESSTENILFKIDFASNLLCEIFSNTRILEQLMYKQESITKAISEFTQSLHLFYEILVNIEYNNRVMNAFLKLSCSFENFLMLYFYHHNSDAKSSLDSQFIGSETKIKTEFEVIQQRIRNFGKTEEKNHLNSLLMHHRQKSQLFKVPEASNAEDLLSILNDEKQIEFLLQKPDTRTFFISSFTSKELEKFAQYLIGLDDKPLLSSALDVISQSQITLDGILPELLKSIDESTFESQLEILNQLPLACASDDNKKMIFQTLLKQKITDDEKVSDVVERIFKNDSYKMIFKDFKMKEVVDAFDGKFKRIHQALLSNAARKINVETLENFNWILKNGDERLMEVLAQISSEVSIENF